MLVRLIMAGMVLWLFSTAVRAQPTTYRVESTGAVTRTAPLIAGHLYRIIFSGTVSVGPTATCTDTTARADALYVYGIDASEEARGHMPDFQYISTSVDDTLFWGTGTRSFLFTPVSQLGLRMNGLPLPYREFERDYHRYMIEVMGSGEPLDFSFLDLERVRTPNGDSLVGAYADNCGSFSVTITNVHPVLQQICDITVARRGPEGRHMQVRLPRAMSAATIKVNGMTVSVDSVECPPLPPPSSVFFLLDRSGSLRERDVIVDGVRLQRSEVMDIAVRRALLLMQPANSVAIAGFSSTLMSPSPWIKPPRLLADSLDIMPTGATNLYGSLTDAARYVRRTQGSASIILISDGGNNYIGYDRTAMIDAVNAVGGTVGIVLLPDQTREATARNLMDVQATLNGIRQLVIRRVDGSEATDAALGLLLSDLDVAQCCTLNFMLPLCEGRSMSQSAVIEIDSMVLTVDIPCTPPLASPDEVSLIVAPTPSDDHATVVVTAYGTATVSLSVFDVTGKLIAEAEPFILDPGSRSVRFDTRFWAQGAYTVMMNANGVAHSASLMIVH